MPATTPEKTLCKRIRKTGGRDHHGVTTARFRGGGARKIYRLIDFKRKKDGISAEVATVEYDPNRNCFISLLHYADGEKRYIIAPEGLKVAEVIVSGTGSAPEIGNALPLGETPLGTINHKLELKPGAGSSIARSTGA